MRNLTDIKHVIVQGITGTHGSFHTQSMIEAGTHIVAGTSPNKSGHLIHGVPVYSSIASIQKDFAIDASVIFVPAPFAKAAMIEAIDARIPLIVCITEGVPIHDMLEVHLGTPGTLGIVSRSGTLTYEAIAELTARGMGQKYIIGIGGDRIPGTSYTDCLELFQNDPDVSSIVLIGEIGGTSEQTAAEYIKSHVTKPVYAYIAGHSAPLGVQLGHVGAILNSPDESASAKTAALRDAGVFTATSLGALITTVK